MGIINVRKRKQDSSESSTEYSDIPSGACSIEQYVAFKDPFRVAPTGKIPVPYPYDHQICSVEAHKIDNDFQEKIIQVMKSFKITYHTMTMQKLSQRGFPETAKDTVIISTLDTDTTRWEEAANTIYQMVEKVATKAGISIRVEIANPELMYWDVSSAIKDTNICRVLERLQPAIIAQVKASCPTLWTSIAFHNRKRKDQYYSDSDGSRQETGRPTVMVFVEPKSRSLWGDVEKQLYITIEKNLSTQDMNIALEILPGYNIPAIGPPLGLTPEKPLILENIPTVPTNGASIGPQRSSRESGSLGAIVYFQAQGEQEKQICFLTCYHVIASGDPLGKRINDEVGIGLDGRAVNQRIEVNWPSKYDLNYTKKTLADMIAARGDVGGRLSSTLTDITERFTNTSSIGYVKHASGLRHNDENSRLDWALVALTLPGLSDTIKNKLPPSSAFQSQFSVPEFITYRSDVVVSRIGEPIARSWVGKYGRTSNATAGEVNGLKRTAQWADGTETTEVEVLSLASGIGFAERGDSGSLVFNLEGEWVGMVIGVDSQRDIGYVTPAHNIIADIMEQTGGSITLV